MLQSKIDHKLVGSFQEFLNWKILKNSGFSTISTGFYQQTGIANTQVKAYASPFKSFVYLNDADIGATVISGVSGNGTLIGRGTSGLSIDFKNGRVLLSGNQNIAQLSGSFALNDVNIKYTTKSVDNLLLNTKYVTEPIINQVVTGIAENTQTYPIIWLQYIPGNNTPRAFGGMDDTNFKFTAICITNSMYLLDGLLGIFRDTSNCQVGVFDLNELPLNISGDLKDINYTYTGIANNKHWPDVFHIKEVFTDKFDDEINTQFGQNVFIGEANFNCSMSRYPRQ